MPLDEKESFNSTHTEFIPLIHTEFLPERDIPDDKALRDDYEKLRITYELQRDIGSEIDIDFVLNRILDRTFEFLNYDRGIILLVNKKGKLKPRAYKNLKPNSKFNVSSTLIRYVLKKKTGVISSDILSDDRFNTAESMISCGIRSSIAVPILHNEEVLGVIIIHSSERVDAFTEKDLHLLMNIANHTAQFIKNSLLHEELLVSFESAIRTLSATVDARHPLTAGHSERVARFSVFIAREMGLDGNSIEALRFAALLHDIGKIGIPDTVLLKEGPFESCERNEMNSHPMKSKKILENFHFPKSLRTVPEIAGLHHERVDGQGYPKGIAGDQLPIEAKIMTVADVFDALTSARDYPKYDNTGNAMHCDRMPISEAISVLESGTGSHFDSEVVAALKRCLPLVLLYYRGSHFEPEYVDDFIKSKAPHLTPQLERTR